MTLLERLKTEVLVTFGGVFTGLVSRGHKIEDFNQWAHDHPREFQGIYKEHLDAGCHIVAAGGSLNRFMLERRGQADKVVAWNVEQAQLLRKVTPRDCYVSGSVFTTGHILKPAGDITFDQAYEAYTEQILALVEGGVDNIWIITFTDAEEASAAIKAAKDHTRLPVLASMAFDRTLRGFRTTMGVDPQKAARRLKEAGADVVGMNCGSVDAEDATAILKEMRGACEGYLLCKPNAGVPQMIDGKRVYPLTPEQMAKEVSKWVAAGARIVGACCGSDVEHVRAIVAALRAINA